MKNVFKLSGTLLLNQFLACVAGGMCVIPSSMFFGNGITGSACFLAVTLLFFAYIEYKAAFNSGFHDADRRNNPKSKKYLYKGALAGLISAIPLIFLIVLYFIAKFNANEQLRSLATIYTGIASMYYAFPLSGIIPNHVTLIFLTSVIPLIIFPCLGYIAGYKNFVIFDIVCRVLRIKPRV